MYDLAKELTIAQIWAALATVFSVVVLMGKHFKAITEAWPSIQKAWKYVQKKWFADAIFKKDLMDTVQGLKTDMQEVKKEVQHNGGSSLKDAVRRMEIKLDDVSARLDFTELKLEAGYQLGGRMTAVFNRNAECIEVNPVFLKFFGWSKDDILQASYENIVHEEDRREMQVKFTRAVETGSKFSEPELRMFDSDGAEHKVRLTGYPNYNRNTAKAESYFITFEILNHE